MKRLNKRTIYNYNFNNSMLEDRNDIELFIILFIIV